MYELINLRDLVLNRKLINVINIDTNQIITATFVRKSRKNIPNTFINYIINEINNK